MARAKRLTRLGTDETGERAGVTQDSTPGTQGHGWWPYVLPYVAFLASVELLNRVLPEDWAGLGLVLKPAVPAVLLVWFAMRGAYPELRRRPELRWPRLDLGGRVLDVAVGLVLAVLWVAPFVFFETLRPEGPGFDLDQLGEANRPLTLGLRLFGYALVTPLFEEIFIRSFVMRYSEVYRQRGDFRTVPLAHYTLGSFVTTTIVFTLGHVPWEWWVAVPWVAITNLWFYYRKDLWALILTHATTNAALLGAALFLSDHFSDGSGNPISLWFFV